MAKKKTKVNRKNSAAKRTARATEVSSLDRAAREVESEEEEGKEEFQRENP